MSHHQHPPYNGSSMPQSGIILHAAPKRAVEQMIQIVDIIHDVYRDETAFLARSDINGFKSIQGRKLEAAQAYEQGLNQMLARRNEMRGVEESLKNKLRLMHGDFNQLAQENKKLLDRMQRTTERLSETICNAAKDAVQNRVASGYGASGRVETPRRTNMSVGIEKTA